MKISFFGLFTMLCLSSCYYISRINNEPAPSFEKVKEIMYSEIRREFNTGIAIDQHGFQLEPEWHIYFTGDDSVKIFSLEKQKFISYRIFHSHKDLFQFARQWFRVKHVSKDSILLQVMQVSNQVVHEDLSNVFMTLYADDHIKNKLHTSPDLLRRPSPKDSLFVKYRAIQANSDPDSAFAARSPVVFKSKSKIARAEKIEPRLDPNLGGINRSESYLYPEYKIYIDKAYRDFTYSFYAVVDYKGRMKFKRFNFNLFPEFIETKTKVAKGLINIYLRNLFEIIPGKTLGYPHSSIIVVHVIGKMDRSKTLTNK